MFSGYFLRIKKGKEIEILDFDTIVGLDNKLVGLSVDTVIPINYTKFEGTLEYGNIEEIQKIKVLINSIFFNKFLVNNYFTEPKDIKLNDFRVKENLLKARGAFFNWFYIYICAECTGICRQCFPRARTAVRPKPPRQWHHSTLSGWPPSRIITQRRSESDNYILHTLRSAFPAAVRRGDLALLQARRLGTNAG